MANDSKESLGDLLNELNKMEDDTPKYGVYKNGVAHSAWQAQFGSVSTSGYMHGSVATANGPPQSEIFHTQMMSCPEFRRNVNTHERYYINNHGPVLLFRCLSCPNTWYAEIEDDFMQSIPDHKISRLLSTHGFRKMHRDEPW